MTDQAGAQTNRTSEPTSGHGAQPATGHGRSVELRRALDRVWEVMADDYGLLPDLAFDAVMARADRGELEAATPRLLELTVGHQLAPAEAGMVVDRLGRHQFSSPKRSAVEATLDGWWAETLALEPGSHPAPYDPGMVLGVLASYQATMTRWLAPWLFALDGPAASHLAKVVLGGPDGLSGPAWEGKHDQAQQVLGWARTEAVVNGMVVVGGVHLAADQLSDVLDRLI